MPAGRPKKKIDRKIVRGLASRFMTTSEIAAVLEVSPDTIERRFHNDLIKGKEQGKASLRRKQYKVAMAGNVTALIWLGKNVLGQKDQVDVSGSLGVTMRREEILDKLTKRPAPRE